METDLLLKGCRFSVQRFNQVSEGSDREHSGIIALSSSIRPVGQLKQKYRVTPPPVGCADRGILENSN